MRLVMTTLLCCSPAFAVRAPEVPAAPPSIVKQNPSTAKPSAPSLVRIAVYPLEHGGIDDRVAQVLTDAVLSEVRKLDQTIVIGMDEIKAMLDLEAQKQIVGCVDASCLAEIGAALGVDRIVIGSAAVVGDGIVFGLKHIDQKNATTLGQATRRIDTQDPADVLAAIGPVVQEVFADMPLRVGAVRGVPAELALRIHPPPLSPVVPMSLAAVAVGVAVVGGAMVAVNVYVNNTLSAKLASSKTGLVVNGPDVVREVAVVQRSFIAAVVSFAVASVVASAAGISVLFTDFSDAAE